MQKLVTDASPKICILICVYSSLLKILLGGQVATVERLLRYSDVGATEMDDRSALLRLPGVCVSLSISSTDKICESWFLQDSMFALWYRHRGLLPNIQLTINSISHTLQG